MAFTIQDVVDKAVSLGSLDVNDSALMERVSVTAEMVIAKATVYIGYDSTTVDDLKIIFAEITVNQVSPSSQSSTKRITRGDYTVEYDTNDSVAISNANLFSSYEWILKKYKKLRSL
jgi:hypothetical protein